MGFRSRQEKPHLSAIAGSNFANLTHVALFEKPRHSTFCCVFVDATPRRGESPRERTGNVGSVKPLAGKQEEKPTVDLTNRLWRVVGEIYCFDFRRRDKPGFH